MKIQILVSCAGVDFAYTEGEVTEVSTELAKDLIKAGYAQEIKKKSSKGDANADA